MVLLSVLLLLWGLPLLTATCRLTSLYLINKQMLIHEALNACRSNNTDLVTIYDEEENVDLGHILTYHRGWIGANSCKWSNGDPVTFINITTITEEKCCCAVNTTSKEWECFNCSSTKMYFMCYNQGQESYNYSLIHENKTWFEAQRYCRENHTDLVSIRNEMEKERVKEAANGSDSFWIGLQYNCSLDWFVGGCSEYRLNSSSEGYLIYLLKKQPCWMKIYNYSALCYKSFIHVSVTKMSWEDALDYCNRSFSGLLTIQSENDQIETDRELKRRNISGPVWVGLRQSRLFGFWIWIDGINMGNWSNWKGGSQPEHLISEHCGAIEKVDGQYKWSDKDCRKKYRVLCERK